MYHSRCNLTQRKDKLTTRSISCLHHLKLFMCPCSLFPQPCLPIYVSELKLAFFLVMAIQFGSAVFWVRIDYSASETPPADAALNLLFLLLSSDYFTGHEHQADGTDKEEAGVYSSSPVQQIRSWCFLVLHWKFLSNVHGLDSHITLYTITWLFCAVAICYDLYMLLHVTDV